jgi:hypothetical protein
MTIRPCLGPLIAPASAKKKRKRHQTKKFSPVSCIRASLLPSQISDKQPQSCFSPLMQDGLRPPLLQPRQLRLVLLFLPFVAGQGGAWLLPRVTGQGEAQLLLPRTAGQGGALLLPHAAGWRGCFFLALPVREGEGRGCFLAPPARVAASSLCCRSGRGAAASSCCRPGRGTAASSSCRRPGRGATAFSTSEQLCQTPSLSLCETQLN